MAVSIEWLIPDAPFAASSIAVGAGASNSSGRSVAEGCVCAITAFEVGGGIAIVAAVCDPRRIPGIAVIVPLCGIPAIAE